MGVSLDTFSDSASVAASACATSPKAASAVPNLSAAQSLSTARTPPTRRSGQASALTTANIAAHTSSANATAAAGDASPSGQHSLGFVGGASPPQKPRQFRAIRSLGATTSSAASSLNTSTVSAPGLSTNAVASVFHHSTDLAFRTPPVKHRILGTSNVPSVSSNSHLSASAKPVSRSDSANVLTPAQPAGQTRPGTQQEPLSNQSSALMNSNTRTSSPQTGFDFPARSNAHDGHKFSQKSD